MYVKLGQNVRKGDELLSISSPELENSVKQSKASLDLAKASYSSATGGSLEAQVNQAKRLLTMQRFNMRSLKEIMTIIRFFMNRKSLV